jgi:hypothetical protein
MKLIFSLLFTLLLTIGHAQQSNPMVADESPTDATFMAFKAQLQIAVDNRDVALLLPLLADSVRESINNPCQYCAKQFFVDMVCAPNDGYFWEQAELLLQYGFKKGGENNPSYMANKVKAKQYFTAPAFIYDAGPYDTLLVLANEAAVHTAPFADSAIIATITYGKVATHNSPIDNTRSRYDYYIFNADENTAWVCIQLPTGQIGYVLASKTSATLYKEMTVAKLKGQWKIISFYHPPGC